MHSSHIFWYPFIFLAAPIIPVLVPFIVDMATGNDIEDDIVINRIDGMELSLYVKFNKNINKQAGHNCDNTGDLLR